VSPTWPFGRPGPRFDFSRNDFGAGLANPSEPGGLPELFDVIPNRASSSPIRTTAAASPSRNSPFPALSPAFSTSNSSYEGCGETRGSGTRRSKHTRTGPYQRHADHTASYHRPNQHTRTNKRPIQLRPNYDVVQRQVGHLACGDLMIEPILGEVRVVQVTEFGYDEVRHQQQLQVHWASDDGLSTAARLYPAAATVAVRVPALTDQALIRQGIDLAVYQQTEIDPRTARTIAAQLQRGPGTALYAFAVSGTITDRLYEELEEVTRGAVAYGEEMGGCSG